MRGLWDERRYEFMEGVLTLMPAARLGHGGPIGQLIFLLQTYSLSNRLGWTVAPEVDVAASPDRVLRTDLIVMTEQDIERQKATGSWDDEGDDIGLVLVPPTLAVEALSKGHERHD